MSSLAWPGATTQDHVWPLRMVRPAVGGSDGRLTDWY
jgi:hypothetical protein